MKQETIQLPTTNIFIGLGAITLGLTVGLLAHNLDDAGTTWVLTLLIFSAGTVGVAQQTIP